MKWDQFETCPNSFNFVNRPRVYITFFFSWIQLYPNTYDTPKRPKSGEKKITAKNELGPIWDMPQLLQF